MSAYITLETPIVDKRCLLAALEDLGFGEEKVEVHEKPVQLVGYRGDARLQKAHIIIRRKHLSASSNDLGFLRTEGRYQAIVSDYDMSQFGRDWQGRLRQRYEEHYENHLAREESRRRREMEMERRRTINAQKKKIEEKARELGYRVESTTEGKKVKLVLRRRVYN